MRDFGEDQDALGGLNSACQDHAHNIPQLCAEASISDRYCRDYGKKDNLK